MPILEMRDGKTFLIDITYVGENIVKVEIKFGAELIKEYTVNDYSALRNIIFGAKAAITNYLLPVQNKFLK